VQIDWELLAEVAVVAAAAATTVVLLVAFALVGLSARAAAADGTTARTRRGPGTALAALCLLTAGLIAGYGLYLFVH
jgi:hypothetical protein